MNIEIERKFLVKNDAFRGESFKKSHIKQGYLNSNKKRVVRVRIIDEKAFITIKGKSNESGTTRFEWEKEISIEDAEKLMLLTENTPIEKHRFFINHGNHIFEVDAFLGENTGLIIAEVELNSEEEVFKKPKWLANEVTGVVKYYNASLLNSPYTSWK